MVMDPTAGQCEERAGLLFPRDCGREAVVRCDSCGKPLCIDHRHEVDKRDLCTTCTGKLPDAANRFRGNPFIVGRTYYPRAFGLPHDPNDFTEADGQSTRTEGNEPFENDLGAS